MSWKPISQYDLDGNFIRDFRSAKDAEIEKGYSRKNISNVIRKKSKTACGFVWKYKGE